MDSPDNSQWLESVLQLEEGYEEDAVEQFADRLIRLASSRLPARVRRRVDPEDIVQSAFRSFFSGHEAGRFTFQQAPDVWRLLAAITYHKVQRAIRYHHQQQRDVNREGGTGESVSRANDDSATASSLVIMMELLDGILERLPETHRRIVAQRLDGYTIDEIAASVDVSSRTVNRALELARKVAMEMIETE